MLLPGARAVDERNAQRVVVVCQCGKHRPDIVDADAGGEPEDQRDPPATGLLYTVFEEPGDIRGYRQMCFGARGFGQPGPGELRIERGGQAGHGRVLVQMLRGDVKPALEAFVEMPIAISESPPNSKKLAFRSSEVTPRHCVQMRCSVASVADWPLAGAASGAVGGRVRRDSSVAGLVTPRIVFGSIQCRSRAKG